MIVLNKITDDDPEGIAVLVHRDDGSLVITRTRSKVWSLDISTETIVSQGGKINMPRLVKIDGLSGGYDATRVYVLPDGFNQWMSSVMFP